MEKDRKNISSDSEGSLNKFKKTDDQLNRILEATSKLRVPESKTREEAWMNLQKRITKNYHGEMASGNPEKYKKLLYPFAASILIIIGIFTFQKFSGTAITVPRGHRQTILLPDQSKVLLNAESTLSYSKFNWKNKRKVKLKGEAFFEVIKSGKFEVICKNGLIRVKGTSFNVFSREDELEIKCFTGKVEVSTHNAPSVLLQKNEAIKYSTAFPETVKKYKFNPETAAGWRKGECHFDNSPLREVLNEMERQFDVEIYSPENDNRKYTGYFKTEDLKKALDMICIPMDMKYNIIDKKTVRIE